ncbi:MAG TPA: LysM peptidoglycan-binding domain-containing protein [Acidimicrobiales bacterium]|nr:LysM peptidoglycan-binding domain-containing protein [Acidimicrobiales bacterium]
MTAAVATHDRRAARLRLIGWVVLLVAVIAGASAAGAGALAPPPVTAGGQALSAWFGSRDAPEAAMAVIRVLVLAMAWYLLGTTLASAALRAIHATAAVRALDMITVPGVRRLVTGAAGLTLAASSLASSGALGAAAAASASTGGSRAAVTMHRLPSPGDPLMRRLPDEGGAPVMHRLGDGEAPAAAEPPAVTGSPAGTPAAWTVAPGDSLWRIAERTLAASWGRAPTDAQIAPYWHDLVEANRRRLADPANPDLIFPGQVFEVPPPPLYPA